MELKTTENSPTCYISHNIYLKGIPDEVLERWYSELVFKNKAFIVWKSLVTRRPWLLKGKNKRKPPEEKFILGSMSGHFPLPFLQKVLREFPDTIITKELCKEPLDFKPKKGIDLWQHQIDGINIIPSFPYGIILSGTGSGKTRLMLKVAEKIGYTTLFVVTNNSLLEQAVKAAKQLFDCEIGVIGNKQKNISGLTIATIQSLYNMDRSVLYNKFGTVIFDEVDMYPMAWRAVLTSFNASRRYGDTATLKRSDGNEKVLEALLGPVIYKVPEESLLELGVVVRPKVVWTKTNYSPPINYSLDDRYHLLNNLSKSEKRNLIITNTIREYFKSKTNARILVLTDFIDHVEELNKLLIDLSPIVYHGKLGYTKKEDGSLKLPPVKLLKELQKAAMESISSQHTSITIATYTSMSRGTDNPGWNCLVIGLPFMGKTRNSQAVGRVIRSHTDKEFATVLDFQDSSDVCLALKDMQDARQSFYTKTS